MTDGSMSPDASRAQSDTAAQQAVVSLDRELDVISLNQALIDFEIANARAFDLARRLMEAHDEIKRLNAYIGEQQERQAELDARYEQMQSSGAWTIANRIWSIRNALRR